MRRSEMPRDPVQTDVAASAGTHFALFAVHPRDRELPLCPMTRGCTLWTSAAFGRVFEKTERGISCVYM